MVTVKVHDKVFEDITGIIFDKDGTLSDSQSYLKQLAQKRARLIDAQVPGVGEPLLMSFGMLDGDLDPAGLMAVGSNHENAIAAAAYIAETGRSWFEALAIAKKAFEEAETVLGDRSGTSPLFTGSLEVLKFCHDAGLKLGILSMDNTANVKKFVQIYQLQDFIQLEMGAEFGLKPDPDLFLKACRDLGTEPSQTLMVGDAPGDIQMANNAGAAGSVGICWGDAAAAHLDAADVAIASLDALEIIA
ncbi:HAD-superfamily hydrolase, subfamily IA, variant 1 [[Leptolyngbya] sp. PCC 7376]|uniref:HAD family hydrolase n=1 Tax=[Leptolyngbya] sp. PCC 7376 TaxID=111781 RepID=UPI00029EE623|nr:HAD family hydrolase [[Leptolyngbya] sp. PCC 7376]AFY37938.1 HAD-superfamily hydrolase, subfamily IA, variant 1 [[Leptolyngbya] sp. PCC 7376]